MTKEESLIKLSKFIINEVIDCGIPLIELSNRTNIRLGRLETLLSEPLDMTLREMSDILYVTCDTYNLKLVRDE